MLIAISCRKAKLPYYALVGPPYNIHCENHMSLSLCRVDERSVGHHVQRHMRRHCFVAVYSGGPV